MMKRKISLLTMAKLNTHGIHVLFIQLLSSYSQSTRLIKLQTETAQKAVST